MRKAIPGKAWHWMWKGLLQDDWLLGLYLSQPRSLSCPPPFSHPYRSFIPVSFLPHTHPPLCGTRFRVRWYLWPARGKQGLPKISYRAAPLKEPPFLGLGLF